MGARNDRLARALAEANLTYWQAAGELQVDPKTVQRWISTGRTPQDRHRYRLAKLVNVSDVELWPKRESAVADIPHLPSLTHVRNRRLHDALGAAGLTLEEVGEALEVDPKTVQRWLTDGRVPYLRNRRRVAKLLDVRESYLWPSVDGGIRPEPIYPGRSSAGLTAVEPPVHRRDFLSGALAAATTALAPLPMPPVAPEVIDHFSGLLGAYWKADRVMGPHLLIGSAVSQCQTVLGACDTTTGRLHRELLQLGVAYTGLVSWLYQDAGDIERSSRWLAQTLDLAHRADDPQLVAYALTSKALVHADTGDGLGTVELAAAALASSGRLSAKARVMAMQHAAFGYALMGERSTVDRFVDDIGVLLDEMEAAENHAWGGDRLRQAPGDIVDMQRATCYERLGLADQAVELWDRVMHFPAGEKRDRGVYLARHASALVDVGEPERAAHQAAEGLGYLRETGSARMHHEFMRLRAKASSLPPSPLDDVLATIAY